MSLLKRSSRIRILHTFETAFNRQPIPSSRSYLRPRSHLPVGSQYIPGRNRTHGFIVLAMSITSFNISSIKSSWESLRISQNLRIRLALLLSQPNNIAAHPSLVEGSTVHKRFLFYKSDNANREYLFHSASGLFQRALIQAVSAWHAVLVSKTNHANRDVLSDIWSSHMNSGNREFRNKNTATISATVFATETAINAKQKPVYYWLQLVTRSIWDWRKRCLR